MTATKNRPERISPKLKEDLLKRGHIFRSHNDTEVILHLYEEYNTNCIEYLRGMFAFAIADIRSNKLFLGRDRLGQKPLYYALSDKNFYFASEIRSLLLAEDIEKKINNEAIYHYLTYKYISGEHTAFKGIQELKPAHWMLIDRDGKIEKKRYWKLNYASLSPISPPSTLSELNEKLISYLKEAIQLRLMSDVPLGVFLSGGVDSSAIVALMSQLVNKPIKTFAIGFGEKDYNELPYARIVAKLYNTEHYEFIVEPKAINILPKLIWHYSEPFADPSAIPTYYVSEIARKHITVVLNGDAGDENFAGYLRYRAHKISNYADIMPNTLWKLLSPLIKKIRPSSSARGTIWKLQRLLEAFALKPKERNLLWHSCFTLEQKKQLYNDDFKETMQFMESSEIMYNAYEEAKTEDFINATLYTDVNTYLPDNLLVKVDIASMAHSLEARSPFLDHKLMEFTASLSSSWKINGLTTKYLLKKALEPYLPKEILYREKQGFGVPLERWFREDLKEMSYDILLSQKARERGFFNMNFIEKMLKEHTMGKWHWHYQLWTLLILELWQCMFIDKADFPINPPDTF